MVIVDMDALKRAAFSSESEKVTVDRIWLRAVHELLSLVPPPSAAERDRRIAKAIDDAMPVPIA